MSEYNGVFVFAQQVDGVLASVSLELLGKARELASALGTGVTAVLLGSELDGLSSELAAAGADRVIAVENPVLSVYMNETYTESMCMVIEKYSPEIVLIGATAIGRDLAPRVSCRVHTGLTADCTGLEIQEETNLLLMTRPAFGGNIMATITCPNHRPQMATVRPGVFEKLTPEPGRGAEIIKHQIEIHESRLNVDILNVVKTISDAVDLQNAKVIVAGGRGMGGEKGMKLLEKVAGELGGVVAASRAAVDSGWIEKDRQIGQTGKTVRPELYIACGISGAIQHLAGMEGSETIIAINKDEDAPIFGIANYGIVGDVFQVLPKLLEQLKEYNKNK